MKAKRIIYITDVGQREHFSKIFDAAKQAGWLQQDGYTVELEHVGFGVVQDATGNKFKTRSGDTIKLNDLLSEAVLRAEKELQNRFTHKGNDAACDSISADDIKKAANSIGLGSVKYFDLKQTINNNYKFSFDSMLDPRGNTAVYIMYAYVRICQIFKKANVQPESLPIDELEINHETEIALAKVLLRLPGALSTILSDFSTNKLAEYLYDTSVAFSSFYMQCKVVGAENQTSRLLLCLATKIAMKCAMKLLGLDPIERI